MPWFDKALKSVQGTAEKAAFEADKMVRVQREQGALNDMQGKVQVKLAELGQATLALYRTGMLTDPAISALAAEIAGLEAQVHAQHEKLEALRTEQHQSAAAGAAPVAPPPAAAPPTLPPVAAPATPYEPAAAPATVECPNCHAQVKANAAFCPECGNRMK